MNIRSIKNGIFRRIATSLVACCACANLFAQDCPNLAGSTSFAPSIGHDGDYYYSIGNVELDGPMGNFLGTSATLADSAHAFHPDSTRFVYAVTDSLPRLVETFPMLDQPAMVTSLKCDKLAQLLTFTVTNIKPGTTVKVTGSVGVLYADEDDGFHRVSYDGGKTYNWKNENSPNLQVGTAGDMKNLAVPYDKGKVAIDYEYTLGASESSVTFIIQTGYNFNEYDYIAFYGLKIQGCLNPVIKSSQGSKVCQGEQALFTLNKEYNASSYKWEWNDGSGWSVIGTGKSVMQEIMKPGSVRCTMDGIMTEPFDVEPIVCCEVNNKPASRKTVFFEDFGHFKDAYTYVNKDGDESKVDFSYRTNTSFNIPMHDYDDASGTTGSKSGAIKGGQINDGTYAVIVPTPKGYYTNDNDPYTMAEWMNGVVADHTSALDGNANGAALFINVNKNYQAATGTSGYSGPIFQSQIDGLCANKELTFETYIANMSGGQDPYVSIYIMSTDLSTVYGKQENVLASANGGWIQMKIEDIIVKDATSVVMQVVADCGSRCNDGQYWEKGNDLIIDDIKFMTCAPPSINIYSDLENFTQDTTICSDVSITVQAPTSKLLEDYFGGIARFLYQASVDGGKTWTNLANIDKASYSVETKEFAKAEEIQIRVIVGSSSALDAFWENPNAVITGDDCSDYSISDPFIITRAGDIDMGNDFVGSDCKGAEVTLIGVENDEVASWKWQDDQENDLTELSKDVADKDYTFELLEETEIYFIGFSKDGCKGKRKYTMKMNPTAEVKLQLDTLCGKSLLTTTVTPSTATITATLDDAEFTLASGETTFTGAEEVGKLKVTATATGYCESPEESVTIVYNEIPEKPKTKDLNLAIGSGNADFTGAATATGKNSLNWYTAYPGSASANAPELSLSTAGTFEYWVSQVSEEGCEGDTAKVTVVITSMPSPKTRDTVVCVNSTVDLTTLAEINPADGRDPGDYELVWYEDNENKGSATPITVNTATAGIQTYYVTQKDTKFKTPSQPHTAFNPHLGDNESDPVTIVVEVYGAPDLSDDNIDYCVGDTPTQLTAGEAKSTSDYIKANGYLWYEEDATAGVTTAPTPSTDEAGKQTYGVTATYTLSDGTTCESANKATIEVNVYETTAPSSATIQYIKSDADGNNNFPALTDKSSYWTEGEGYTYKYSSISESSSLPTTQPEDWNEKAPQPNYDVNTLAGGTATLYCYVTRVDKNNPLACYSTPVLLTIRISDALPPLAKDAYVCEGEAFPKLEAKADQMDPANPKAYEIRWYGTTDPTTSSDAKFVTENPYDPSVSEAKATAHEQTSYYYYVTQYDPETKAESAPTKVTVTVYPKPQITLEEIPAQCDGEVDLSKGWSVSNMDQVGKLTAVYTNDASQEINSNVDASGDYIVKLSYSIATTDENIVVENATCYSEPADIKVQIDHLTQPYFYDSPTTACPLTQVDLNVQSDEYDPNVTYEISGTGIATAHEGDSYSFETSSKVGTRYGFVVKAIANTCEIISDSFFVTVGDGPVVGTMNISEEIENGNASLPTNGFKDDVEREVYTCGGDITLTVDYEKSEGDYTWYLNNQKVGEGASYTIDASDKANDLVYEVRYVNQCNTAAQILVHNQPFSVTPTPEEIAICENESFIDKITVTAGNGYTPQIQWYLNDEVLTGASASTYSKSKVSEKEDEGQYSYVVTNGGCMKKGDSKKLDVLPYIQVDDFEEEMIAPRSQDFTITLKGVKPTNVSHIAWIEKGETIQESASPSYTIPAIDADHTYTIELSDPAYCPAQTTATVWVDALLQLKVDLTATMCEKSSSVMEIDTTGTGAFRQEAKGVKHELYVERVMDGTTTKYTEDKLTLKNGKLQLPIVGESSATYTIVFKYGEQREDTTINVKVIPAISVKLPEVTTICEGEETELSVSDVSPEGTTISWKEDPTILNGRESESITVKPTYNNGTNHQSTYTYTVIAYNEFCKDQKEYTVKVNVDEPLSGEIAGPISICEGASAQLDASSFQASQYTWSVNGESRSSSATINDKPSQSTVYDLEMSRGTCQAKEHYTLEVTSLPEIASVDSVGIRDRNIITVPGKGTGAFRYWVDNEESSSTTSLFEDLKFNNHIAYVQDERGCKSSLPFVVMAPPIIIDPWFSPNGDGIKDTWVVKNLTEIYPNAVVQIFDRYGKLLIEFLGDKADGWDGTYNGQAMPSTDYWYLIDIEEISRQYKGHFTLIRR